MRISYPYSARRRKAGRTGFYPTLYGIAPVIAGLFIEKTGIDMTHIEEFTPSEKELLAKSLYEFYKSEQFTPCIIYEEVGDRLSPKLMCPFVPALPERLYRRFASPSEMLNEFYSKTEKKNLLKTKAPQYATR